MFTTQTASSWRPDQIGYKLFQELDTRQQIEEDLLNLVTIGKNGE